MSSQQSSFPKFALSQDLACEEINHTDGVSMGLSNQDRDTADGIAVVVVIAGRVVNFLTFSNEADELLDELRMVE